MDQKMFEIGSGDGLGGTGWAVRSLPTQTIPESTISWRTLTEPVGFGSEVRPLSLPWSPPDISMLETGRKRRLLAGKQQLLGEELFVSDAQDPSAAPALRAEHLWVTALTPTKGPVQPRWAQLEAFGCQGAQGSSVLHQLQGPGEEAANPGRPGAAQLPPVLPSNDEKWHYFLIPKTSLCSKTSLCCTGTAQRASKARTARGGFEKSLVYLFIWILIGSWSLAAAPVGNSLHPARSSFRDRLLRGTFPEGSKTKHRK